MEVFEPAQTKLALRIVFIPKTDITFRLGIDFRNLNAETIRSSYPLFGLKSTSKMF